MNKFTTSLHNLPEVLRPNRTRRLGPRPRTAYRTAPLRVRGTIIFFGALAAAAAAVVTATAVPFCAVTVPFCAAAVPFCAMTRSSSSPWTRGDGRAVGELRESARNCVRAAIDGDFPFLRRSSNVFREWTMCASCSFDVGTCARARARRAKHSR